MSDMSERLARQVRAALAAHNDDSRPVVECVAALTARCAEMEERLSAMPAPGVIYADVETTMKVEAAFKDAARWRWARQDETLWGGTYCYGISLPDGADKVADCEIAAKRSDADGGSRAALNEVQQFDHAHLRNTDTPQDQSNYLAGDRLNQARQSASFASRSLIAAMSTCLPFSSNAARSSGVALSYHAGSRYGLICGGIRQSLGGRRSAVGGACKRVICAHPLRAAIRTRGNRRIGGYPYDQRLRVRWGAIE
jgi:hypothetical protein